MSMFGKRVAIFVHLEQLVAELDEFGGRQRAFRLFRGRSSLGVSILLRGGDLGAIADKWTDKDFHPGYSREHVGSTSVRERR